MCGACQRARSTAPTVLARKMRRSALRPPRSAIVRLRSGAVASRPGAFRIAAFRYGGGGPRGWHGRAGASARRSLRHRLPVRRRVRASSAHERHPARSEYLPSPVCRPCAAMRASRRPCALRPRSRRASAGALSAHVCFCGARSARLTVSKVSASSLDCADYSLDIPILPLRQRKCPEGARGEFNLATLPALFQCHGGAERAGGAAARGGGGDGGRRGQRQARCRRR